VVLHLGNDLNVSKICCITSLNHSPVFRFPVTRYFASICYTQQRSESEGWDVLNWALTEAELKHLVDRDVRVLSGGELQRFAISVVAVQMSDVYMFDEPSSYLDVKQRLTAAAMIRQILEMGDGDRRYVLVVEHDLAVLDYLSDFVCVLYGQAGGYGVVTMPHSVRMGINAFLAGFIPSENLRFRENALTFKVSDVYVYICVICDVGSLCCNVITIHLTIPFSIRLCLHFTHSSSFV
jgi:ABC-type antimicrobial peptide transport system ATPase subunit